MLLVIAGLALILLAIIGTVVAVIRDGYGPVPTDWTRLPDRPSAAPGEPEHRVEQDAG